MPILKIRGVNVMLDADLARLYGVETKALNQAVKRNVDRFPEDFRFQLTRLERDEVVTICDHLKKLKFSASLPFVFTEHGALMAANLLNSDNAISMSVFIVRAFVKARERLAANNAILKRLAEIDKALLLHDTALQDLYDKLLPLLDSPPAKEIHQIGFNPEVLDLTPNT